MLWTWPPPRALCTALGARAVARTWQRPGPHSRLSGTAAPHSPEVPWDPLKTAERLDTAAPPPDASSASASASTPARAPRHTAPSSSHGRSADAATGGARHTPSSRPQGPGAEAVGRRPPHASRDARAAPRARPAVSRAELLREATDHVEEGTDAAALGHALQRLANKWPPAAPPRSAVAQQEQAALCQDVIQLCQALQRRCPTLDAGVISAACHAFAKLCARDRSFQRRDVMRHVEAMVDALRARAEAPAVLDAFSGREMVRCVWAFAKLHLDYEDLLVAFAERLPRDVGALGSRDIAMLLWALAVLRIPEGPLEPLLQALSRRMRVRDVLDSFSLTSLSNVCLAMGRLMFLDKPLMAALGRRVRAPGVLDQAPPRGQSISNILWAFAVLEVRDTALLQALAEWLVEGKRLQAFSPQAIGNVAFAYSALKWRHHGLHTALPRAVQRALPRLTNKQVATTLRALVKIGINDPELMRDVAVRLGDRAVCAELTTQDVIMISAAFAHTDTADADTMQALGERLLQREEFLRANDIALLVWAFGRAKANVPGLLDALTKPVLENPKTLRKLSGKGMAIIVWGCAKVGYRSEPLLELLLDRLRKKKFRQQLKHFNIVDLMWAVGELGFVHQKLMTCMAYRIEHHIDAFDCQQLATLAYAYARLHFPHKTLMSLLARRACEPDMAATFTPPAMALILRAFADMGLLNRSLLRVMGARLREPPVLRTVTPADVATLMAVAQAQGLAEAKAIISALGDLEKDTSPWTGGRATETGEDGARGWLLEEGGPATGAAPADRGVRRRRRVRRARSAKGPALRERLRAILRARIRERIRDSKPPP